MLSLNVNKTGPQAEGKADSSVKPVDGKQQSTQGNQALSPAAGTSHISVSVKSVYLKPKIAVSLVTQAIQDVVDFYFSVEH